MPPARAAKFIVLKIDWSGRNMLDEMTVNVDRIDYIKRGNRINTTELYISNRSHAFLIEQDYDSVQHAIDYAHTEITIYKED